jgi:hypothetical protein
VANDVQPAQHSASNTPSKGKRAFWYMRSLCELPRSIAATTGERGQRCDDGGAAVLRSFASTRHEPLGMCRGSPHIEFATDVRHAGLR